MTIGDIIENLIKHLRDIAGDVVTILKKDNEKIVSKLDELKVEPKEPKDYTRELKAIETAVKEQEVAESVNIKNPEAITGDLKAGLQGVIEALQKELKNFDKNIVVKNDFSNFATLFKTSQDKKSLIAALKKIEDKIEKPETTDYTMILSDIAKAVEDKEAVNILKGILEKEYNVQFPSVMAVDLDPNLIEESRVKVKMSDEQVKIMSSVGTSNSRPIVEKLTDIEEQNSWLQQLGIDKDNGSNYYFGFKKIDTEEWRIKRINKTTLAVSWATGTSDSNTAWANRTAQSYGNL